jgi:hypothetical protein
MSFLQPIIGHLYMVKRKKPSVLLVGTSNIKGIEPSQLSTKYYTSKETAYTIDQATNIIQDYPSQPDVKAYHILSNQIKNYCMI